MSSKIDHYPTVAVVIETDNLSLGTVGELFEVLHGLRRQGYPREKLEILVIANDHSPELHAAINADFPEVRFIATDSTTYYGMKIVGVEASTAEIVAFLDSDCQPGDTWLSSMVDAFEKGADVVAGKSRYTPGKLFSTTFNLFQFGHIRVDEDGEATAFIINNVAFRRQVLIDHPFDPNLTERRTGAGYALGRHLKSLGYRVVYQPDQLAFHKNHGLKYHLANRLRAGHEIITLCQTDSRGVMAEKRFLKFGLLSPFLFSLRRLIHDHKLLMVNRSDLDIKPYMIPCISFSSLVVRGIEAIGGVITLINPQYLRRKFGW